jgi:hypothetical protein
MEHVKSIGGRHGQRRARRRAADGRRAALAALAIAGLGSACLAGESISSLGAAFRPQGTVDAPAPGNGERTGANLPGLRVVVSSPARSLASIDGQIVRVGDMVNGMRVAQIDQQGVLLVGEGGVRERLTVSPSAVKRERPAKATNVSNGARQ